MPWKLTLSVTMLSAVVGVEEAMMMISRLQAMSVDWVVCK